MNTCSKCGQPAGTLYDNGCFTGQRYVPNGEVWCYDCLLIAEEAFMQLPEAERKRISKAAQKRADKYWAARGRFSPRQMHEIKKGR